MRNCARVLFYFCVMFVFSAHANMAIPRRDPFTATSISTNQQMTSTPNTLHALHSCWIPLYFSQANTVAAFLSHKSSGILSPRGKINFDKRSNQIWLKDDSKHIARIRRIIKHLDQPGPQFLIKAKIINIDRQYQKKLGVLFHDENATKGPLTSLTMNEPDTDDESTGEFTITIAKLAGSHLLNLELSALEQEGHAVLISNPSLTTLNNQPALIESGAEVPYEHATSSGATSVSFKKAVLRLQVTPQRMPDHHILLHISLNQDKVSALTVKGVPAIQTQRITTQVIVRDQETIVLGGILETSRARQKAGTPVLDKVPVLGGLFQQHTKLTEQQELLIFITPSSMKALS